MTEEQIKQNAEKYALKKTLISTDSFHGMVENYLAGAHSRDEEIKELKTELESIRKGFYERGDKLKELMPANNKLRNDNKDLEQALACAATHN